MPSFFPLCIDNFNKYQTGCFYGIYMLLQSDFDDAFRLAIICIKNFSTCFSKFGYNILKNNENPPIACLAAIQMLMLIHNIYTLQEDVFKSALQSSGQNEYRTPSAKGYKKGLVSSRNVVGNSLLRHRSSGTPMGSCLGCALHCKQWKAGYCLLNISIAYFRDRLRWPTKKSQIPPVPIISLFSCYFEKHTAFFDGIKTELATLDSNNSITPKICEW